jgi:hypothetical protein
LDFHDKKTARIPPESLMPPTAQSLHDPQTRKPSGNYCLRANQDGGGGADSSIPGSAGFAGRAFPLRNPLFTFTLFM